MAPSSCKPATIISFAILFSLMQSSSHVTAREIIFPPIAAVQVPEPLSSQHQQRHFRVDENPNNKKQDDNGSGAENRDLWSEVVYAGLTTFANIPWIPCQSSAESLSTQIQPYDIAILGAPFDTATTGRPGARFGPTGIRRGSRRISPHGAWNAYTHTNSLLNWAHIVDCGDAPLTYLDNTVALKQLVQAHEVVSGRQANDTSKSSVPRIITLGGDHTTTLAALRSTIKHWGPVSVIHFDSHIDTWDPKILGGGFSHYAGVNHGTFLHIAHEEGLLSNDTNMHAGIRAPVLSPKSEWQNDQRCGFDVVTARDLDRIGIKGVIERIRSRVGGGSGDGETSNNVYISVDIDVLDPAHAPATGTAEVGGWTTRELLSILDGLTGLKVIGADVVEVAPAYDNTGETTLLAAAEIVNSLIALMVDTPVKSLHDLDQGAETEL